MAGNITGGKKAAAKNKAREPDFYKRIGRLGGRNGKGHEFAHGKVDPGEAGRRGSQQRWIKARREIQF